VRLAACAQSAVFVRQSQLRLPGQRPDLWIDVLRPLLDEGAVAAR
jgi:hypothetical protein